MVRAHILYSKLVSIAREMGETLQRLAHSPLIAQERAYASGLLDSRYRLAVQLQGDPLHMYALRDSTRSVLEYFSYDIAEGDVLIVADPYCGGTQGHVLTVAAPMFHEGENRFTAVLRVPLADLGGEQPGVLQPQATDLWQEALRITPLKLRKGGVQQPDILRYLVSNSRAPDQFQRDLEAMVAVLQAGIQQLAEFLRRYSVNAVESTLEEIYHYSSSRVHRHFGVLSKTPGAGSVRMAIPGDDRLTVKAKVRRDDASFSLDFTSSSSQVDGPFNVTRQSAMAAAALPLLAGVLEDVQINEGTLKPLSFTLPEGCVLNPEFPAAFSLGAGVTCHAVAAAVVQAARSIGGAPGLFPSVHGIGASAVLYPAVGSVETMVPLYFEPGFCCSASGWGPPGLRGERQLVSAEELESQGALRLRSREVEDNATIVRLATVGRAMEASFAAIGGIPGQLAPLIRIGVGTSSESIVAEAGRRLAADEVIEFSYPVVNESDHVKS